jgi:hypothetical protein
MLPQNSVPEVFDRHSENLDNIAYTKYRVISKLFSDFRGL